MRSLLNDVLNPEFGIQHTYTYVNKSEHHRIEFATHISPLSKEFSHNSIRIQEFEIHFFPKGPKKHINFFNINFLAPTQNAPFWVPRKSLCASFPGKGRKKGTHINFFGRILGSKGAPNGPFPATKSSVYCFFPALIPSKPLVWGHNKGVARLFRFVPISSSSSGLFRFFWNTRICSDLLWSGVAPANQTKERSVHEFFAGAFRNKNSMWIVLVFLRKNTRIHKNGRNSWTFRFGPCFGLVCQGDSWSDFFRFVPIFSDFQIRTITQQLYGGKKHVNNTHIKN